MDRVQEEGDNKKRKWISIRNQFSLIFYGNDCHRREIRISFFNVSVMLSFFLSLSLLIFSTETIEKWSRRIVQFEWNLRREEGTKYSNK